MRTLLRVFLLGVIFFPLFVQAERPMNFAYIGVMSPTTGCAPLPVQFLDDSFENQTDPFISWEWDFGDGGQSTDRYPLHTYTTNGSFTVRLIVTKQSGIKDTATEVNFVNTQSTFSVDLGPDTTICSGSSIVLDATVPGASSYMWEDGSTTAQVEKYMEGEYHVTVVKDGCEVRDTIYVTVGATLAADFDYYFDPGCTPIATTFTDLSQSCTGAVSQWLWDFGDGTTSTEKDPVHNYAAPGDYTVTLTVTNSVGSITAANKTVSIIGTLSPTVSLGGDRNVCEVEDIVLTATGTGVSYLWNTGATTNSITVNTGMGQSQYYVTAELDGCFASDTVRLTAVPELSVNFTYTKLTSCLPMTMQFTDNTVFCDSDIHSWNWDFGDGTTSTEQNPQHTYTSSAQFPVRLVVMLNNGLSSQRIKNVLIAPIPFEVDLGDDIAVCEGEIVALNADAGVGDAIYEWSTGETTQQIQVAFDGEYSVKASYNGCEAFDTIQITNVSPVQIKYGYEKMSECLPVNVQFADSTEIGCNQTITSWNWDFGDGTISTDQHPVHAYHQADSFNVRLTVVTSGGNTVMTTKRIGIINTPFTVDLPEQLSLCAGVNAQLDAGVTDAQYSWYPSSGLNDASIKNPVVQPLSSGWYYVDVTKCMVTVKDSINILLDSVITPIITQEGNLLKTTAAVSYVWYKDGEVIPASNNNTIKPDKHGYYSVKVSSQTGCEKTSGAEYFLPLSGNGKDKNELVRCTPNPSVNGVINLVFTETPIRPARVTVYDFRGLKVLTAETSNTRTVIPSYNLLKGLYLVEVILNSKRVTVPIVVK